MFFKDLKSTVLANWILFIRDSGSLDRIVKPSNGPHKTQFRP